MAQLMVNLANRGEIDMKQLTVQFIDEEAIFPCMEDMTKKWRRIFMMMGAKFEWYCVEVKHFNCFNELSNDETFICWDSTKQDVWVRQPPSFAIRNHKLLRPRIDTYQISCQEQPYPELQWLASGQRNPYRDFRILRP